MKNLLTRAIAGIIYVAIILTAILADPSGIYFLGLFLAVLASGELQNLCCGTAENTVDFNAKVLSVIGTAGVLCACLFAFQASPYGSGLWPALCYFIQWMTVFGAIAVGGRFLLTLFDKRPGALQRFAYSAMGWIYIALPLGCLCLLSDTVLGWRIPLMLFVMIWLNDTGAYCVGSLMGKHRLCERLSPKKSWEGFWGGLVFSVIAGAVFALLSYKTYTTGFAPYDSIAPMSSISFIIFWALTGAVVSVAATWGDLFESLIKRTLGVKDSGHLIPGHGGILDRIDSLLFAAPTMLLLMLLMPLFG